VGSLTLAVSGLGAFLDGLFRLDCRGIDAHCTNDSWHSHAHKIESGVTAATLLLAPLVLAFAFRRNPRWRGAWLPTLCASPGLLVASTLFSAWGDGAATRAGTVVAFLWIGFVSVWLLRTPDAPAPASA
jgi:hypothetical protein